MKLIFKPGDTKEFRKIVATEDCAIFNNELLHPVYATFALARDMEWSSRLFFIDMREEDEEGVGTHLTIDHRSPAFVGEEVIFIACVQRVEGMELDCTIEARVGQRLVATGRTGQKMLKKEKLKRLFAKA